MNCTCKYPVSIGEVGKRHCANCGLKISFMQNELTMKTGIEIITEERQRHFDQEGWTPEHDDQHVNGELANAAAYYALTDDAREFIDEDWGNDMHLHIWPFDLSWLKLTPEDRIKQLAKAGSMIAAEIDRIQRLKENRIEP